MFLKTIAINGDSIVSDIVKQDYRAADVFRKHDISYCCGGRWPLSLVCESQGLDLEDIRSELEMATRQPILSHHIDFMTWEPSFLAEYIKMVHHAYLRTSLPSTGIMLNDFIEEHRKKYPYLDMVKTRFDLLSKQLLSSMEEEEEVLFPYIRRLSHAYHAKESYASLLVKTLRKPVEQVLKKGQSMPREQLYNLRGLTGNYSPPENTCISHKVLFAKLKELDIDITQHYHLEEAVLLPKVTGIEKDILNW